MHIKAGLVTKKRTGELIGFTNLDDTERELIGLQGELQQKVFKPRPAKKILVFMVQGITCENVKSVIAMYLMDHLCAVQLCSKTWEVICNLEEAGIRVLSITCDGAETNRKFINMHQSLDSNCKLIYCTKNLMSGDFRCMTALFATQSLSGSVADCIEDYADYEIMKTHQTKELVKLIRLMNTFFDCMNGKEGEGEKAEEENLDKAAYRSTDDRRFNFLENDFLQFFKDWIKDVSARDGKFTDSERNAMTLSQQTLDALVITVNGVIGAIKYMLDEVKAPRVNARVFIQDPLEQYFGILKRDNRQPFLNACLNHNLTIQASKTAALPPRKGNTTAWKRSLEADSSHVLVLKKDRKKK
ncbi:hypothetical protein ONE63_003406 [Megalurothrips usitatus]|uniref:Transposable element P transposase n=1 Tax=Megalurothrips usitatus TaxID=439358 RepID=A0AAV7X7Y4_9NEOP|nr:hypothetical protein ONE63_003406 [Megalurothrips usitatus]